LKESIQDVVCSVSKGELQHEKHTTFLRCSVSRSKTFPAHSLNMVSKYIILTATH